MNFDSKYAFNCAIDLIRGEVNGGGKITKSDIENQLRDMFGVQLEGLEGRARKKAVRRAIESHKSECFAIVEEIVNTTLGEDVFKNPFVDEFVEVKNLALGDTNEFYSEGGLLNVSKFAGNHWDTNRQSIDLGTSYSVPTEWIFIHVYDEWERFLLGITTLDKLYDKIAKSLDKYINSQIFATFSNLSNAVPSDFVDNGNTEAALGELADKVATETGSDSLIIAGTQGALRKLASIVDVKYFSDIQKNGITEKGIIPYWEGNRIMKIPQTFKSGTYEFALDDTQLIIMGAKDGSVKPIKLVIEGDSRSLKNPDDKVNQDQTIGEQIQTKLGVALAFDDVFGIFNFTT